MSVSQELGYVPNFSKLCTLLKEGYNISDFQWGFWCREIFPDVFSQTFSRLVIFLGNPSCFIYWVCGNYMVAQILCISISCAFPDSQNDFLISYFSRGCSLNFNAFPGCLFGCFQFEEAPPGLLIFSIQVVWEELIMISNHQQD